MTVKTTDFTRKYMIDGYETEVSLGETVWWFPEGQTNDVPMVAFVTRLGDGGMITIRYFPPKGSVTAELIGVVPIGDERLKNPNVRKKGAWCTRALWPSLQVDK